VYPFIAAEKDAAHTARKACALLLVSRSAYYQWSKHSPSARADKDAQLGERITAVHHESRGTYGSPRVHRQLQREGIRCGRKRVARLMGMRGLAGRTRRRFKTTTIADPAAGTLATDHLRRAFTPASVELDRAWVGDITYLRTWEGWAYLATVIDLASRRVVGLRHR
jgi:transposase InsO family protein